MNEAAGRDVPGSEVTRRPLLVPFALRAFALFRAFVFQTFLLRRCNPDSF
jgi:hypothetical protein